MHCTVVTKCRMTETNRFPTYVYDTYGSQLVACKSNTLFCLQIFYVIGCDPQVSTLILCNARFILLCFCHRPSDLLLLYTFILIRSRTPIISCQAQIKSPKCPCHSSMKYMILSPSGTSSDCFSANTTLLRLSSLQLCCPHDE